MSVTPGLPSPSVILSFDVEEHHRIEAAAGLNCPPAVQAQYGARMEKATQWLLEELNRHNIRATFFVVGDITSSRPALLKSIHRAGHEVASHGWDHRRIHHFSPAAFRADLRQSKDALEQAIGAAVVGYRAPTFSVVRSTAWALDVLAEMGFRYDSSIYPVRHDRYGVPEAPRGPFLVRAGKQRLLEFPPATFRWAGLNLPVGGGGYFRLLPLVFLKRAIAQVREAIRPAVVMLYFHPWEFDPDQPRLPLGWPSRWRTYVGIRRSRQRLRRVLERYQFRRAVDVVIDLEREATSLPEFVFTS
jgi:polysaccharide deacetylase family protein (PEP-CTERM system associated)